MAQHNLTAPSGPRLKPWAGLWMLVMWGMWTVQLLDRRGPVVGVIAGLPFLLLAITDLLAWRFEAVRVIRLRPGFDTAFMYFFGTATPTARR